MAGTRSIVVIGGGIAGLCCAYFARLRGHEVTVIDRGKPDRSLGSEGAGPIDDRGEPAGCSFGNAGMVVPSHIVPLAAPGMVSLGLRMMLSPSSSFYFHPGLRRETWAWAWRFYRSANAAHVERSAPVLSRLHLESRRLHEEMDQALGGTGLERKGIVMLCRTERGLHEEAEGAERARHLGLPGEVLSPEECARLEPCLRMTVAGGVYYPQDAHLTPGRLMAALASALETLGVRFIRSAEVIGFRVEDGRIVAARTSQGETAADAFVLAAGSWSARLACRLGLRMPLVGGKGYSVTLSQPRWKVTTPAILTESRVAVTPMGPAGVPESGPGAGTSGQEGGHAGPSLLRFAGTMEIGGLDLNVSPARVRGIQSSIPGYFPDFGPDDFQGVPAWCGLRPCSPDGMPYVGPFRRYPNLYAATGHAMMGISLGPITGRLIAELLSGEAPSVDLTSLSPDRFG